MSWQRQRARPIALSLRKRADDPEVVVRSDSTFRVAADQLGSVEYAFDSDLLPTCAATTACPSGAGALTIARSAATGYVTGLSQGQLSETWGYNTYGELASQVTTVNGQPLLSLVYDTAGAPRDKLGRVKTLTETRSGTTRATGYTYDTQGRLATVRVNGALEESYTYDDNGNRLTATLAGVGTLSATYDAQDRLEQYGDWEFTYGANGELHTKTNAATNETWTFDYDTAGNLLSVEHPDGRFIEYLHDGRNRRVAKLVDGVKVRQWIYQDQLNPVLELDGTGAVLYRYVYATMGHSPDYVVNGAGATYRVVRDQLGSPLLIVNILNPSDVLLDARYSAFGTRTATTVAASAPTLGYAGGIYDEDTGLTRFGARDYDGLVGRWTSKDPILWDGGQGNLYVYVESDPANYADPTGEFGNLIGGALLGGGLDLGIQLLSNGGDFECVDWGSVATSAALGTVGAGFTGKVMDLGRAGYRASVGLYQYGGGGLNVFKNGKRIFAVDWHAFKLGGKMVNRPHLHLGETGKQLSKHWPWQVKGGGGLRLPWD